jgi:RHS repeat-associated protein
MNLRSTLLSATVVPLLTTGYAVAASNERVTTTVYVGRHFEARDHDQPVKYVFNSDTRVARITGSLSTNLRLQRLRLRTGWNLISLAVSAPDLLGQFQQYTAGSGMDPLLNTVYRWRPITGDYTTVGGGETVAGGTVLWLQASTNFVVAVRGDYTEPTAPMVPAGGGFVQGPGLEAWPLQLPPNVTVWKFDAGRRAWQAGLAGDLAPLSDIPSALAPGEAIYVHPSETIELSIPEPDLRIAYYHQDHLGSSSVVTDSAGRLAEETAHYPFGAARHQHRPGEAHTHYGFTQKETDRESGLNYFEARYHSGPLARFLSFDPMIQRLDALKADELRNVLTQPAKFNPFVYALNNPLRYTDPDGRDARSRPTEGRPRPTENRPRPESRLRPAEARPEKPQAEYTFRVGPASKVPGEFAALSLSIDSEDGPQSAGSGHGRGKATFSDFHVTRESDKESPEFFRKSADGRHIKSVLLIIPGKEQDYHVLLKDVLIGSVRYSDDSIGGKPVETLTLNAGSVQFGDPEAPAPPRERNGYDLRLGRGQ